MILSPVIVSIKSRALQLDYTDCRDMHFETQNYKKCQFNALPCSNVDCAVDEGAILHMLGYVYFSIR